VGLRHASYWVSVHRLRWVISTRSLQLNGSLRNWFRTRGTIRDLKRFSRRLTRALWMKRSMLGNKKTVQTRRISSSRSEGEHLITKHINESAPTFGASVCRVSNISRPHTVMCPHTPIYFFSYHDYSEIVLEFILLHSTIKLSSYSTYLSSYRDYVVVVCPGILEILVSLTRIHWLSISKNV